ncbi:hypothetical protein EMPS_04812 [Entomortierella parvispora]|uniref:Uncharacterized protein n=1 Tax=Entomortierella parvispora TaxID=205924 RepID=A0A9P3H9I4_9FUNG|nr:hypothetical protein EMPS_04812 [Entomortierella parvispora]
MTKKRPRSPTKTFIYSLNISKSRRKKPQELCSFNERYGSQGTCRSKTSGMGASTEGEGEHVSMSSFAEF